MVTTKSISSILPALSKSTAPRLQLRLRPCWLVAVEEEEVAVVVLADMSILLLLALAQEVIPLLLGLVEFRATEEALRLAR